MLDKESLSTRRQIKYFTDEVPDQNIIKHIIADTIAYAPVKNNRWDFILDVYDNSWDDQKQLLLYKTACNWLNRKDIIKHWTVDQHKEAAADTTVKSENYNHQVTAPYLIVARKSNRQYDPETGPDSRPDKKAVAAGSVAATLSFVTRQYGLYGGFCSCYTDSFNSTIPPNMIIPDKDNFYFMFGIGYPDEKFYKKYHNAYFPSEVQNMDLMYKRPTEDQVSEWM